MSFECLPKLGRGTLSRDHKSMFFWRKHIKYSLCICLFRFSVSLLPFPKFPCLHFLAYFPKQLLSLLSHEFRCSSNESRGEKSPLCSVHQTERNENPEAVRLNPSTTPSSVSWVSGFIKIHEIACHLFLIHIHKLNAHTIYWNSSIK